MPRVKVKPPNYLKDLFRRYRDAQHLTSAKIAKELNTTPENVRAQTNKDATQWRISDLVRYCEAYKIPLNEAFECIEKGVHT